MILPPYVMQTRRAESVTGAKTFASGTVKIGGGSTGVSTLAYSSTATNSTTTMPTGTATLAGRGLNNSFTGNNTFSTGTNVFDAGVTFNGDLLFDAGGTVQFDSQPVFTAGLNVTGDIVAGNLVIATSDFLSLNDPNKGVVIVSPNFHYWRVQVTDLGVLTVSDLGTSPPT